MSAMDHLGSQFADPKLYHGTNVPLREGDYIESGYAPHGANFPGAEYGEDEDDKVYATPHRAKAHWYAVNAVHEQKTGSPHTYEVAAHHGADYDSETQPEDFESDEAMHRHGSRMASSFRVVKEVQPTYKTPGGTRPHPPLSIANGKVPWS